jgi:5'-phosphate synthase pdxT subunit
VRVGVLAFQGDVAEHVAALAELGVEPRSVRRPDELAGLQGMVVPGGESTTISLLLESSGLAEPLGKELAAGFPVFGTCAGMILLASSVTDGRPDQRCYGAIDLTVRRNGFGRQLDSFECDLTVPAVGDEPVHAVFIRAPLVESVGDDVEVLASLERSAGDDGLHTPDTIPVLCRQGNVLVSAFHPELTGDRRLHGLFLSMVDDKGR